MVMELVEGKERSLALEISITNANVKLSIYPVPNRWGIRIVGQQCMPGDFY
jgi:hypothetical protein